MKKLKYIFLFSCLWLVACTQDNEWLEDLQPESMEAVVHLNLQCAEINVKTRSTTPQDPQTDNPMYHLYLLHYNNEGQLIEEDTQEKDFKGNPQLTCQWNPTLRVTSDAVETICLVANMKGAAPAKWPETLAKLKESCATLQFGSNGLIVEKKMYMFGYYEGTLTSGQYINIMMGRMAATLKFVVNAANANETYHYRITNIEIINASKQCYYFPHNSTNENFIGDNISESFKENNEITSSIEELTFYYQIGENIYPTTENRTKVKISAQKGERYNAGSKYYPNWQYRWGATKNYTVVLGSDAPGTANRNYSLYRNNNYTFNITLNN